MMSFPPPKRGIFQICKKGEKNVPDEMWYVLKRVQQSKHMKKIISSTKIERSWVATQLYLFKEQLLSFHFFSEVRKKEEKRKTLKKLYYIFSGFGPLSCDII